MAESGLTLGLLDFRKAVSEYVHGGDGNYTNNSPQEQDRIDSIINQGLRQFYAPPTAGPPYVWTFLTPVAGPSNASNPGITLNAQYATGTIQVVSGVVTLTGGSFPAWAASGQLMIGGIDYAIASMQSNTQVTLVDLTQNFPSGTTYGLHQDDYQMPDDFSALAGPITYRPADNAWIIVQLVGEGRIRELRQFRGYTGYALNQPWMAAIQPQPMNATLGTRQKILLWPRVVNTGVLSFRYRARPAALTTTNLYPYGASDHSETILASIMAVAELKQMETRGAYWDEFQRLVAASIAIDSEANRADKLGYNGDNSDNSALELGRHVLPSLPNYRGMQVPPSSGMLI